MADDALRQVSTVCEVRSQHSPGGADLDQGYDDLVNEVLSYGWALLTVYVEGRGSESGSEECVSLMGWPGGASPRYPAGYSPR